MTFRDEAERLAWSSAWDAVVRDSPYRHAATLADAKIEAMRERMPEFDRLPGEPAAFIKPEQPGAIPGVKPMDPLSGLAKPMDPAPNTGSPPPGGGRIHYAIQRGAELAWARMWERRVHLSHCDADRAHVIDCIYDAMVDSVVENPPAIDAARPEPPGTIPGVKPMEPSTRSERPALERLRDVISGMIQKHGALADIGLGMAYAAVLDELAKQPEPELPVKVKAVIEAARQGLTALMLGSGHENLYRHACEDLAAALKALDEGGAK